MESTTTPRPFLLFRFDWFRQHLWTIKPAPQNFIRTEKKLISLRFFLRGLFAAHGNTQAQPFKNNIFLCCFFSRRLTHPRPKYRRTKCYTRTKGVPQHVICMLRRHQALCKISFRNKTPSRQSNHFNLHSGIQVEEQTFKGRFVLERCHIFGGAGSVTEGVTTVYSKAIRQ